MNDALRHLIAVLRRQADSLEAALLLTEAQTSAIARRDIDAVSSLAISLETEVVTGRRLEQKRRGFAASLANALGVEEQDTTLGTLAAALPKTDARALLAAGETVIRAVERLARQSAANRVLLENELAVIDHVMRIAHHSEPVSYRGSGAYQSESIPLLDTRA
jgi:hypothetical protein